MSSPSVSHILDSIAAAGTAHRNGEAGSRETLIDLGLQLVSSLEIPSEFIQRTMWAEPARSAHCRLALDRQIFQHLRDAGDAGISAVSLAEKTGLDVPLLQRVLRHLVAMYMVSYTDGKFHATALSNGLAKENYQQSIAFCYDVSRPSFNNLPEYLKQTGYKNPLNPTDGAFQAAHKSKLPFFDWLVANPPHLSEFDSFMSAYRAGKANWYDPNFYPVAERLIGAFDPSNSDVLLVDVGGGRGHDLLEYSARHPSSPGRLILQDREPVIASVQGKENMPFEAMAHDFYTPQPIKAARAYLLHSILHDWDDNDGVLLNEIVLSEEHPTLAATSMDMMMLAHLGVRERTEADWRAILARAGLKVVYIYSYPGVEESLIEAELE
ncbi:hypothetical protein AJ79_00621 [Helicocarpus griseus UAMH5409]|uniref:O-methyltransferase C-terminal domain-containing protein n=1 Tax=Helicocarpus griseus UAMH5409 TaxID=1447875 RepID=A0A2B7YBN5_9EURO|nr:hypothetical protein AJ79_00621 [Helicocarpus griseus UAMH5409]